jgi:hypothetical protein
LFLSLFIICMAMIATPAFAQTNTQTAPKPTATLALPTLVDALKSTSSDDASRYAERELQAKQQADFKGGDGVVIGITASAAAVVLLILLLVLL